MKVESSKVPQALAAIKSRLENGTAKLIFDCLSGFVVEGCGLVVSVKYDLLDGLPEVWVDLAIAQKSLQNA